MNKLFLYVFMGVLLLCAACKDSEKTTPNGLKYTVIKAGSGKAPKAGEMLIFNFELRDSKDSVWNDSYKDGVPAYMQTRDTSELKYADGITQMLNLVAIGDSVKTTMTIKDFFNKLVQRPVPPGIDTAGSVTYTIKTTDALSFEDFVKWRKPVVQKSEESQIKKYLAANNITNVQQDTSGIYYVIHNNTGGPKPTVDNCVEVKYEGKFLRNNSPFDSSDKISFPLNQMIEGWKIGIPMLSKGDSATFFIPSHLAYGPQPQNGMPPDAVLIFDVTLFDFKNTYDQATNSCK